jgi:hypothetical protein
VADPDIWWHLRNAQHQIHTRSFLSADIYSFSVPGAAWINHEWLAELPLYIAWALLGCRGLFLVTAVTIECIFLGVFYLAFRRSANPKAALLVSLVAASLATVSFGPRTLLLGWLALVAELILLDHFRRSGPGAVRRVALLLPLLFVLWVNTHGSWLIGMVVLITFAGAGLIPLRGHAIEDLQWSREQRNALAATISLSVCGLFLNPYGWRLVVYPLNLAFHQKLNIANVEEWASLDFHAARGHLLLLVLALVFFAQIYRGGKWAIYELGFLLIGVYSAFTYTRFLFLASILIFPLFAQVVSPLAAYREKQNRPWLNGAILCSLFLLMAHHMPSQAQAESGGDRDFPTRALPFLKNFHPQGRVFNEFLWGGYLEWNARQIPVMIDSRVDIFEYGGVLKDYLDAIRLKNTLSILDKYQIRYVLFEQNSPLVYLLEQTHAWKADYQDGTTILLEREGDLPHPKQFHDPGLHG